MKTPLLLLFSIAVSVTFGQVPVNMQAQNRYTYTENFSDINNWTSGATAGTFSSGSGGQYWKGLTAGGSGTIPNGTKITTATTSFSTAETSGGLHRANESLVLLSTGTTDNTSAVAMDLYLNFVGLNAGTLSFNWETINNSAGNRKGSLRVYASVDNVVFTELPAAQVLNFTNNSPTAGVINYVALPATFNNVSTAIIRFYYSNGTGGTTGSRPKLGVDNVKVTAVPAALCSTPQAQPTNLLFGTLRPTTIQGSFSPAMPSADSYLVLASTSNTLTEFPVNGRLYSIGESIDDAFVVSNEDTSFNATGLSSSTQYYFYVFSYNAICSGGANYQLQVPLAGSATTTAGNLPCIAPNAQPTDLVFYNNTTNSISGSFTGASNTDEYLLLRSLNAFLSALPANGIQYNAGDSIGNAVVVQASAATTFVNNNLEAGTTYYYFVFGYNSEACNNGPAYLQQNPLSGSTATQSLRPCTVPFSQPANLQLSPNNIFITGVFDAAPGADHYLVVYSINPSLNAVPVNGTTYAAGASFGNGTVAANSGATAFRINNLQPGTNYYIFVFALNKLCTGGPLYATGNPMLAQTTTTTAPAYNYYFGNLHAHSRFSDGNKDNSSYTPADNYTYAKNSLCMDFLGISEHNHAGAGMNKQNWLPGYTQAQAATSSNFLALYGMEWGVISSGGHVLIYGVDKLLGWEANNYDHYVGKSDYTGTPQTTGTTGLFRFLNTWQNQSFALLAHPSSADYNSLSQIAYNATADSAIVGTAIESGPAFSTATNYNNPASSLSYLSYYKKMLAKGYKIGPSMDHDNHYTTFGRTTYSRLAVIAPTLQQSDFYAAMRNRNFYATQDCDTRISFTLNNEMMGSEASGSTAPAITVNVSDPTNPAGTATIKIMKGLIGNGVEAAEVFSYTGNNVSFTDNALQAMTPAYYYADITMEGARSITSPIWYSKNYGSVLATQLLSFSAVKTNNASVVISWKITKENDVHAYIIERSSNGVDFKLLQQVKLSVDANGAYQVLDLNPHYGLNYYRLKIVSKDGKINYSTIVAVNFKDAKEYSLQVYPNPVQHVLQMDISSPAVEQATVVVHDLVGRRMFSRGVTIQKGQQLIPVDVKMLPKGNFLLTLQLKEQRITKKIVKQ